MFEWSEFTVGGMFEYLHIFITPGQCFSTGMQLFPNSRLQS